MFFVKIRKAMSKESNKEKIKIIKAIPLDERRRLFDIKHRQLEQRRAELEKTINKYEKRRDELEIKRKRGELTAKLKKEAKQVAKKLKFYTKYIYVYSGHKKNEALGFLTVLNMGRSYKVKITRFLHYDKARELYIDICQRKDRDMSKKAKVFFYIHGGGWIGGIPATREAFTTKVAEAGYFVASISYGDAPKYAHPVITQNIFKAIGWLKDHAEQYNIDMDEIFVGGESAGAHLSAMVGAICTNPEYNARFDLDERSRHQKIAGLVLNCGVYDIEKTIRVGFKNIDIYTQSYCGGTPVSELDDDTRKEISPIYFVTEDFPPTFAISGENDRLAVLTFDLVEKLYDLGVRVDTYHGEGRWSVHAFAVSQGFKISREAMAGTISFLNSLSQNDNCQSQQ